MTYPLGRRPAPDPRDSNFLMAAVLPPLSLRTYRYYWSGWLGDQGQQSSCVGFSWTHYLVASPVTQASRDWDTHARQTYVEAQQLDEWPGQEPDYEGTSVRAGAKALQVQGFITEYRWAWTLPEVVNAVLEVGPVVIGSDWHADMFTPDAKGFVHPTGGVVGGHAYLIDGANTVRQTARIRNSWGSSWGKSGRANISFADLALLVEQGGEAVIATEVRKP